MNFFKDTFINDLYLKKNKNIEREIITKKIKNIKSEIKYIELKNININFFIPVWGDEYVNNFLNYSLPCFLSTENLESFKKVSKNSKIIIWTKSTDKTKIQENDQIKLLKKHIQIIYLEIDDLLEYLANKTTKYEFLSILQNLFLTSSVDLDYIFFVYPDFIFTKNSISSCINKISKGFDAIFCPVPQLITEKVTEEIEKKTIDIFTKELSKNVIKFKHKIIDRCIVNQENITKTPSLFIYNYRNKCLLFRNFHLHPLVIKIQRNNSDFFKPFFPSLDEEFVNLFIDNDNYYIPDSSDEMLFVSLAKENEIIIDESPGNNHSISLWAEQFTNTQHRKFIKSKYFIKDEELSVDLYEMMEEKLSIFLNPILNTLNKSDDTLSFLPDHYRARRLRLNKEKFSNQLLEMNTLLINKYLILNKKLINENKLNFFNDNINNLETNDGHKKIFKKIYFN